MGRFDDVCLTDVDLGYLNGRIASGSFIIPTTDALIKLGNQIRAEKSHEDLVGNEYDNDICYNFSVHFDAEYRMEVSLFLICTNGDEDAFEWNEIPLTPEEERIFLFKIIKQLTVEL